MDLGRIERSLKKLSYDIFILYTDELLEKALDEFVKYKDANKLCNLFYLLHENYKKFKLNEEGKFMAESIYKLFIPLFYEISNDNYYELKPEINAFLEKTLKIDESIPLILFIYSYFNIEDIFIDTLGSDLLVGDFKNILEIGRELKSKTNNYKREVIENDDAIDEFLKYKYNTKVYYKLLDFINLITPFLNEDAEDTIYIMNILNKII